jgi:hypothetical protein
VGTHAAPMRARMSNPSTTLPNTTCLPAKGGGQGARGEGRGAEAHVGARAQTHDVVSARPQHGSTPAGGHRAAHAHTPRAASTLQHNPCKLRPRQQAHAPSHCGAGPSVRKNCELLLFLPELAMDSTPVRARMLRCVSVRVLVRCVGAVLCCAVLCCAVLCCAVLCCAVLCCAVLCCAVLCCAVTERITTRACHDSPGASCLSLSAGFSSLNLPP